MATSRLNSGPRFGDMQFSLEDFLGPGTVSLKDTVIEVKPEQFKLKIIKYD